MLTLLREEFARTLALASVPGVDALERRHMKAGVGRSLAPNACYAP